MQKGMKKAKIVIAMQKRQGKGEDLRLADGQNGFKLLIVIV